MPSRQRALAVRLAHTRLQLREGRSAWISCDVIPWSAWLERCALQARSGPLRDLRRLGATEEWLMWREAAVSACAGLELLSPESLADSLRRAAARARDWGMPWSGITTAESAVLRQAQRIFQERCRQQSAYSASDWSVVLREFRAGPGPLVFAGFANLGGALRVRLEELGGTFWPAATAGAARFEAVGGADATDEMRRAARWCREQLERNPEARLLVVDTRLSLRRARVVQALEHELHGSELLGPMGETLYGIEGGQRLTEYPLVQAALDLLQLSGGPLEFPRLAALLRSPYIGCGTNAERAALELALRERNFIEADLARVSELAGARHGSPGLRDSLRGIAPASAAEAARRDYGAGWAREFAARLEAGGWPGRDPLGSEELQQCERLRELLGELSMLGGGGALLDFRQALELLRALAMRTSFEAATPDVPVTLTESIDDPLIEYDGIWVAGLSAESWPPSPRPDAFIPIAAQRSAGYEAASAHGQLAAARQAMSAWGRCARTLVLSWPWADGDVPLQPSQLLGVPARARAGDIPPARADRLLTALCENARRELRPAERALAWPAARALAGGTKILQLQALCPFKAVAELRLGAVPVPDPVPGLDRLERGLLLHRALELVFGELKDSRELRRRSAVPGALVVAAQAACDQALRERLGLRSERLPEALVQNERARLSGLVAALLQQELARAESADYTIAALESAHELELAGATMRVRMDRLDRLEDGRVIVLDYKSGAAQTFHPLDERPRQAQLLAYAVLTRETVAAVAAVHLGADEIRWRGAAAQPALLPRLGRSRAPTAPWPQLLLQWRRVVEKLVTDYLAGVNAVDPLPGACQFCQLPAFCRVDAGRRNEVDPDTEEALEAGSNVDER